MRFALPLTIIHSLMDGGVHQGINETINEIWIFFVYKVVGVTNQ